MANAIMLALGDYRFESNVNPYTTFARDIQYRWEALDVIATNPQYQYVGPGEYTVTIDGTVYPLCRGGIGQVDAMKQSADQGTPLRLVDGLGNVWGQWIITSVNETRSATFPDGLPRKIEFNLELKYYGE
jgi:phage protein U